MYQANPLPRLELHQIPRATTVKPATPTVTHNAPVTTTPGTPSTPTGVSRGRATTASPVVAKRTLPGAPLPGAPQQKTGTPAPQTPTPQHHLAQQATPSHTATTPATPSTPTPAPATPSSLGSVPPVPSPASNAAPAPSEVNYFFYITIDVIGSCYQAGCVT